MKNGFVKVAAATPEIKVNNTKYNAESITKAILEAESHGAKLLVLPEMCVTGYTLGDLLLQFDAVVRAESALSRILHDTRNTDILFAVGLPVLFGDKLFNAAAICKSGEILGVVPKSNIPNYTEFYEGRYFSTIDGVHELEICGTRVPFGTKLIFCARGMRDFRVCCEICEDIWVASPPSTEHTANGATVVMNLSASDETVGKGDFRRMLIKSHTARCAAAYVYADAGEGESTTDMVFAGHNIIAECGKICAESRLFENGIVYAVIDVEKISLLRRKVNTVKSCESGEYKKIYFDMKCEETNLAYAAINPRPFVPSEAGKLDGRCESIFEMQCAGLRRRLKHIGLKTVTIGISGGLDSTLALLVAARTFDELGLDRRGIVSVTMPCFGTTDRTYSNAKRLAYLLGTELREVRIADAVVQHMKDIGASLSEHDVTYENAQARERTQVLMDIANKNGGIVIGTGDLSELALGFATYNGDHMSMYGVNCSVPKTLVRHLVRYAAKQYDGELGEVLLDILDTPVSPELLPPEESGGIKQKTEDIVGPYELHDFFLFNMIRFGFSKAKLLRMAKTAFSGVYGEREIEKWLDMFMRRFYANQFKRSASPDGPKVGTVSLSPRGDWRMPSDACFEEC